jgi:SAM-dependent methyltransferase
VITMNWLADTRTSYDTVAAGYADVVRDALSTQPYLRASLDVLADGVRALGGGPVADLGCGPGHFTAHLRELGVDAFGIDLSPGMIDLARREHPGVRFEVGSMTDPLAGPLAGVLLWWSLIHVPDAEIPVVLRHIHQALHPAGLLSIGFHVGDETRLKTEGYGGHPMKVHVHLRQPGQLVAWLREAGFTIADQLLLGLDQSRPQAILLAHRPNT